MNQSDIFQIFSKLGSLIIFSQIIVIVSSIFSFLTLFSNSLTFLLLVPLGEYFLISLLLTPLYFSLKLNQIPLHFLDTTRIMLSVVTISLFIVVFLSILLCVKFIYKINSKNGNQQFDRFFKYFSLAFLIGTAINIIANILSINGTILESNLSIFLMVLFLILYHLISYKTWGNLRNFLLEDRILPTRVRQEGESAAQNLQYANIILMILVPLLFGHHFILNYYHGWFTLFILIFIILGTIVGTFLTFRGFLILGLSFRELNNS